MSTIDTNVYGSNAGYQIDVEAMRERLNAIRTRLEYAAEHDPQNADRIQDRINKVDSQLDRLDRLADREITITADRARHELGRGLAMVNEGAAYLAKQESDIPGWDASSEKLNNWRAHLEHLQNRLDLLG